LAPSAIQIVDKSSNEGLRQFGALHALSLALDIVVSEEISVEDSLRMALYGQEAENALLPIVSGSYSDMPKQVASSRSSYSLTCSQRYAECSFKNHYN
jgi:hypothetical protein